MRPSDVFSFDSYNQNPLLVPSWEYFDDTYLFSGFDYGVTYATFWDYFIDFFGAYINYNTDWPGGSYTTGEWATIVEVSSGNPGYLTHIIGPSPDTNGFATVTFRVTIDGTVYTLPDMTIRNSSDTTWYRCMWGLLYYQKLNTTYSVFSGSILNPSNYTHSSYSTDGAMYAPISNTKRGFIGSPHDSIMRGMAVRFKDSMKVEVSSTATALESGNYHGYSGCLYLLDATGVPA